MKMVTVAAPPKLMKGKAEKTNVPISTGTPPWTFSAVFALLACLSVCAAAQNCQTSSDLDDLTRTAITAAAQHDFELVARGDTASLRQNAIASVASDFSGIEITVKDYQPSFSGAQATVKSLFLLEADGAAPLPHAQFYCGVFGKMGQTSGSAVFELDNLPPGKYPIVILEPTSAKANVSFSLILQQAGTDWKLAGLHIRPEQVAGHDSNWFLARGREYKSKGQLHNAWLYYLEARNLASPLPFMSTAATDKLYDEAHGAQPADVPVNGNTVDLIAGPVTYKLTAIFPQAVGNDLDLVVRYQVPDASNANQAYQSNVAVIKALVAKYPELKDAFAAVVARAVDASGRDYGTLLAMKDIK
jgi:hypothetical protein